MGDRMSKPSILIVETGGTIIQRKGADGVLRPSDQSVISRSVIREFSRFKLEVERLPPIDSTNMLTDQRAQVAKLIYRYADDVIGTVVIHGTDTMVPTAAALTLMVQGYGKPIMLTGSQIPLEQRRSDGYSNLFAAIISASQDYGEVGIVFGNGVYRGPCAIKANEQGFNAFETPRVPLIGKVGISVEPTEYRIRRSDQEVRLFTDFDTSIGFFYPASGASVNTFEDQINNSNIHGMVVVGFGAGNVPEMYYGGIKMAKKQNKPVVVVTECLEGAADMGIYEVGAMPLKLGAISGLDMTFAMAIQKLMYALGRIAKDTIAPDKVLRRVKTIMHTNYAGEINIGKN